MYEDLNAQVIFELGKLAASKVTPDTLAVFRSEIDRRVRQHGPLRGFSQLLDIVNEGDTAVGDFLVSPAEEGRYLRALAPL